jgi:hypothetical protein
MSSRERTTIETYSVPGTPRPPSTHADSIGAVGAAATGVSLSCCEVLVLGGLAWHAASATMRSVSGRYAGRGRR